MFTRMKNADAAAGTFAVIVGRILIAHGYIALGFSTGMVGSIAWIAYAYRTKQLELLIVDLFMVSTDAYGLALNLH